MTERVAAQQYAAGYGAPPNPLHWVPPPGWVAPPGWAEYQQFLAQQQQQQQMQGGYPQQMMAGGVPYQGGYSHPASPSGHHPAYSHPGSPTGAAPGYIHPASPSGAAYVHSPVPSPRHTVAAGQHQQYAYPSHPGAAYPMNAAGGSYVPIQGQQMYGGPQYPAAGYGYPYPSPEMVPGGAVPGRPSQHHQQQQYVAPYHQQQQHHHPQAQHQQTRPPPPPEPPARPPRVKVAFDDADSDEERLARHDTLGVFDMEDIHEISENDFAELDTGKEQNVADAGIIQDGIAVQPAIQLKDTGSRESTTVPVQSVKVEAAAGSARGKLPDDAREYSDSSDDEEEVVVAPKKSEKAGLTSTGSTMTPPPLPMSRQNSEMNATSGTSTTVKRRSTFGTLLGAAAAMFTGSNRKLGSNSAGSRKGSALIKEDAAATLAKPGEEASAAMADPTATAQSSTDASGSPSPSPTTEDRASPEFVVQSVDVVDQAQQNEEIPESVPESSASPVASSQVEEDSPANENKNEARSAVTTTLAAAAAGAAALLASEPHSSSTSASAAAPSAAALSSSFGNVENTAAAAAAAMTPFEEHQDVPVVHIKVRTLAGKAAIFEVDTDMTLFEFRELIHEHFATIPLDEQRLLFKGKMIEMLSPHGTLHELGFKDNDVLHLVRTVGAKSRDAGSESPQKPLVPNNTGSSVSLSSQQDERPSPSPLAAGSPPPPIVTQQQPLQMLTVLVPPGRGPGDRLRILPQGRGAMLVTVPAGVFAGDRFRVLLPPEDPSELQRAEQLMHLENMRHQEMLRQQQEALARQQQQQASRPQIMAVVVPKGFRAGQVMDVNVPGRGRVRVTIPNGVKAGQQFKFRLPN